MQVDEDLTEIRFVGDSTDMYSMVGGGMVAPTETEFQPGPSDVSRFARRRQPGTAVG